MTNLIWSAKIRFVEIILTKENFDAEVLKADRPILVDFWAEWCGPCHAIAPALREIGSEYSGKMSVGKLNVDEFPDIAEAYQIRSIPNLKIFKNGRVVDEIVGAVPKAAIIKVLVKHFS